MKSEGDRKKKPKQKGRHRRMLKKNVRKRGHEGNISGLLKKYCLRQQILRSHMFVNLLKTFTVNEKDIDRFKG